AIGKAEIDTVAADDPAQVILSSGVTVIERALGAAAGGERPTHSDALYPFVGRQPRQGDAEIGNTRRAAGEEFVRRHIGKSEARLIEKMHSEGVRLLHHNVADWLIVSCGESQQVALGVLRF